MGGLGSGERADRSVKACTDVYLSLDVRQLSREGLLLAGQRFRWKWTSAAETLASVEIQSQGTNIELSYCQSGNSEAQLALNERYVVGLEWTTCHFGGVRPWFRCPARDCRRRVAVLYGGRILACRQCYRLT